MSTGSTIILVAGVGAAAYLYYRSQKAQADAVAAAAAAPGPGIVRKIENTGTAAANSIARTLASNYNPLNFAAHAIFGGGSGGGPPVTDVIASFRTPGVAGFTKPTAPAEPAHTWLGGLL